MLGPQWVHLRTASTDRWSLTQRAGFLRLNGNGETLDEIGSPAFVARRQEHFRMRAATRVEFVPAGEKQIAGLVLRQDEANHYELRIAGVAGPARGARHTRGRRDDGPAHPTDRGRPGDPSESMRIVDRYEFSYAVGGGPCALDRLRAHGAALVGKDRRIHGRLHRHVCERRRRGYDASCRFRVVRL